MYTEDHVAKVKVDDAMILTPRCIVTRKMQKSSMRNSSKRDRSIRSLVSLERVIQKKGVDEIKIQKRP